jgi:ribosomal protein L37AE/L43A
MNSFIHKDCGSIIYVDVTTMFQIVVENVIITARTVKPSVQANIRELNNQGKISFFCPECSRSNISLSEMVIPCSHCGTLLSLSEAYKGTGISGAYCKKHMSLVSEGPTFTIESVLKNFIK